MMLRFIIGLLRYTLGVLFFMVVTMLLGRGRTARRVLKAGRLLRRIVRL